MPKAKTKQTDIRESVKAWVVEADDVLFGPFHTVQQAADWLRWTCITKEVGSGIVLERSRADLGGCIRPVIPPTE